MAKNNNKLETILVQQLKEVYSTMLESHLAEVEMKTSFGKIKIKRISKKQELIIEKIDRDNAPKQKIKLDKKEEIVGETITSPINGVFYISPSPNSPPFVNEGDVISAGTTVCIVEAMKVMNEIKSDKKCKIIKVLCVNGSSVNTGTKLFLIEPL